MAGRAAWALAPSRMARAVESCEIVFLPPPSRPSLSFVSPPGRTGCPAMTTAVTLREYSDALAPHFHDINAQWISAMFRLEDTDREVLSDPRNRIIAPGGVILFAEVEGLGVVGTCALQKTGPRSYELTKMGVLESVRGLKIGEFLLAAVIERAQSLRADPLYLLTSSKCAPAIHLYEKLGFQHDAEIMARYGARYQRCDVAMRYVGKDAGSAR